MTNRFWQVVYYAWNLHTFETEVAQGAELYAQSCLACHGDEGRGEGVEGGAGIPDFSEQHRMIHLSQSETGGALARIPPGTRFQLVNWAAEGGS